VAQKCCAPLMKQNSHAAVWVLSSVVPKSGGVIFLLKDTRLVSNDDAVAVDFLSHVSCVAGAVN